jgi:hypothetical protein
MYQHPGVYIEHVPSGVLAVEAASTSVAAFVGHVKRGQRVTATDGAPVFVGSVSQYAEQFGPLGGGRGGIREEGTGTAAGTLPDVFGHAVNLFFANGGTKAYIVPVAASDGTSATADVTVPGFRVRFTATSGGTWANGLVARLTNDGTGAVTLVLGTESGRLDGTVPILDVLETHTGLTLDKDKPNSIEPRLNKVSGLVTVTLTADAAATTPIPATGVSDTFADGVDSTAPADTHYQSAFDRMKDYRDISIVLLPGRAYADAADKAIIDRAITHAEFMQNRMVIVDPRNPDTNANQLKNPAEVKNAGFPTSPYTALYYPWLTVVNPYFDATAPGNRPRTFAIAPSAAAAGMWARIDGARGVWKAPAGLEATVRGSAGPNVLIGNALQDNLNEWGVNCLRAIIGPTVIWGARTLATKSKPEFRYVPVRRTQSMIGESLYRALQAVVFEPNDHRLWASLRGSVGDFMNGLYRAGAFQGEKASDAWYVRCGLGATMTQGDIDAGIVRVVVGFAPLKPAEFVVVQIQQIVGQSAA